MVGGGENSFFFSDLTAFLHVCLRLAESRALETVAALNALNAVLYCYIVLSSTSRVGGSTPPSSSSFMSPGQLAEIKTMLPSAARVASAIVSEWCCGSSERRDEKDNNTDGVGHVVKNHASSILLAALGTCSLVAACVAVDDYSGDNGRSCYYHQQEHHISAEEARGTSAAGAGADGAGDVGVVHVEPAAVGAGLTA